MRKPDVDFLALDNLLLSTFGTRKEFTYARTPTGVSTQVYRLCRGNETFYMRIAEAAEDSFAPEMEVHNALRNVGVKVPRVIHYEPFDETLARSVIITTELAGEPIDATTPPADVARIYRAAGRDLALVHGFSVRGFDWVRRDHGHPGWPLRGERAAYADYVDPEGARKPLIGIGFTPDQAELVVALLIEMISLGPADDIGYLAHGDFDTTHVFGLAGEYSGIIDFGEIRGTDYTFDFATLQLHTDKETRAVAYPYVEKGYGEMRPFPDDHERRLYLACVMSATHRLCLMFNRHGRRDEGWFFGWLERRLIDLLRRGEAALWR